LQTLQEWHDPWSLLEPKEISFVHLRVHGKVVILQRETQIGFGVD